MSKTRVVRAMLYSVLALAAVLPSAVAHAQNYTFTVIASGFKEFTAPAINASGMVTFVENPATAPVVLRGDGGPLTVIAVLSEFVSLGPAIDSLGRVIFDHPDGRIVTGTGGPLTTLVAPGAAIDFGANVGTCDALRLAGRTVSGTGAFPVMCSFFTAPSLGKTGLYVSDGLSLTRICDEGLDSNNFQAFPFCGSNALVATSSNAMHAFVASPLDTSLTWQSAIAVDAPSGFAEVLLNTDPPGFGFQEVAINDSGSIAFSGSRIGDAGTSIFRTSAGGVQQFTPLAASGAPGYLGAITPSINNGGSLVFEAAVRTLSGNELNGVYTGPDPSVDRVIQTAEPFIPLGGATVQSVVVGNPGINDAGQIAFVIGLGLGFNAVVRADPINRPPVVATPGDQSTPQNHAVTLRISASDPEADPLIYDAGGTLPPGLSIAVGSGVITGAPTAMGVYPVTITVSDPRSSSSVMFTWTVTDPAPEPRTSLTATPDLQNASIALAWVNPSPDLAATIEVYAGLAGESRQRVARLPAGTTSYRFEQLLAGQFCFTVVGVSAANVPSAPSNVACAANPQLEISNVVITPTATTASITWNTNMAATGSVLYALAGQILGGLTSAQSTAGGTTHAVALSGLVPGANYTVQLRAQSLRSGQLITTNETFTAASSGPFAPALMVRAGTHPAQLTAGSDVMQIGITIENHARGTAAAGIRIDGVHTTVEWRCPRSIRLDPTRCTGGEPTSVALLPPFGEIESLAVGAAPVNITLRFPFAKDEILVGGGTARLHVALAYEFFDGIRMITNRAIFDLRVLLPEGTALPQP